MYTCDHHHHYHYLYWRLPAHWYLSLGMIDTAFVIAHQQGQSGAPVSRSQCAHVSLIPSHAPINAFKFCFKWWWFTFIATFSA